IGGILVATVANHTLAALVGSWIGAALPPDYLRWGLGTLFIAMAGWVLIPDKVDEEVSCRVTAGGAFVATSVRFFLAEMGCKTQITTLPLCARFGTVIPEIC